MDVGTTKIAVLLLDVDSGEIVAAHEAVNSSEVTDPERKARGWSEWDADEAVDLTFGAMGDAVSRVGPEKVKGVGVTGQMHGMVLVGRDGRPVSRFIGWRDQRCNEKVSGTRVSYIERMVELAGDQGFSREGCYPATGFMGSSLFWLKENRALPREPATACFLPDYLVMRLTGVGPVTDPSDAGGSGIYDVVSREWDGGLVERLGLRSEMLPEVRKPGELIGGLTAEAAAKTGLQEGTPVCVACGDNQASFLGSVADRRDAALINIGTGGQISLWVPGFQAVEGVDTRCYVDESYLLVGAALCGGSSYSLLNKFFMGVGRAFFEAKDDGELYDGMNLLASEVPVGSDGLVCEPFFTGT
ncbi:MAG: FGGY-family carbohydrate kinase, partial [Candidatus Thorarchaeota archaeon]